MWALIVFFFPSFFSCLKVDNATKGLEQELGKVKKDRDMAMYKLCCLYKKGIGCWPLRASLIGVGEVEALRMCLSVSPVER